MWRPARVPLHQPRRSSLAQQEPAPAPVPTERAWTTEALIGTGVGAFTGALIASLSGRKPSWNDAGVGGGTGFIVANILWLI